MTLEEHNGALYAVPIEHRRIIARWLVAKGQLYTQMSKRPNLLDPDGRISAMVADVLKGAAVDLMDPLTEDHTVDHANNVLADLAKEED